MRKIELAGPGPHDGQRLDVPDDVVAVVLISRTDREGLNASLGRYEGDPIRPDDMIGLLLDLAQDLGSRDG